MQRCGECVKSGMVGAEWEGMKTSAAQINILKALVVQAHAAATYVGFYPYFVVGYCTCHKLVGEALIRRGLVDVAVVDSQTRITINDAGREVLASLETAVAA